MLHNDISNHRGYTIGIRCENFLFNTKKKNLLDKITSPIFGELNGAEINDKVLSLMNYLYKETEMTVSLVIDKEHLTPKVLERLESLPCNTVSTIITNISEVSMWLLTGELTYYVDDDTLTLDRVNSQHAMTFDSFNTLIRRQVKRIAKKS